MSIIIRRSTLSDLPQIRAVYAAARDFMARNGNPDQWGDRYPLDAQILSDISSGGYVALDGDGGVCGAFYFAAPTLDPTYKTIDGAWQTHDTPYAVIHRIAVASSGRGVGRAIFAWCEDAVRAQNCRSVRCESIRCDSIRCDSIRIDTHRDNAPMRGLLGKLGFVPCGVISLGERGKRLAYEKVMAVV